jgi:hypothetical protein
MIRQKLLALTSLSIVLFPLHAYAQCEAHFPFDGNLADASGNGYNGQMIGIDGAPATARFSDGKIGQALQLDGSSAMRTFLDLHFDRCPQFTISAWIYVPAEVSKSTQYFVSTGKGAAPGIYTSGSALVLSGPANGLRQSNAVRPSAGWLFVAGVYDYTASSYSLHWRNRSVTGSLREKNNPPEEAIWIGAFNDKLAYPSNGILIDDVRITGRALNAEQIKRLQSASGAGTAFISPAVASAASCSAQSDCGDGSYCAQDDTCHPDSHLPKPAAGSVAGSSPFNVGQMPVDMGGAGAIQQSADENRPRDLPFDIQQTPPETADIIGNSVQGNMVQNRFDPDAPVEDVQNSDSTAENGMTVGEVLRLPYRIPEPRGDVRDCTSFAEVTRDVVSSFRDSAVATASSFACPMLAAPVAGTLAAATIARKGVGLVYDDPQFQIDLLKETINGCRTVARGFSELPDKSITFWNNNIANGSWATIGPRGIMIGNTENGNLVSPGDRKFHTIMPALFQDKATLALKELNGKARVTARVCKISLDNRYTLLRTFSVNETPGERQDESQIILWDLNGIEMHHLVVILDASGLLGRTFKYELSIE